MNMKESTIFAQRLVYESIHHEGGVRKAPIPLEMGVGRSSSKLLDSLSNSLGRNKEEEK